MNENRPLDRRTLVVLALFAIVAIVAIVAHPHDTHWSPDSFAKFLAVRSLRFDGGLRYDVPYLGREFDPTLRAVPIGESFYDIRRGEVHISWPELFPIVVAPFYRVFGYRGLFVVPALGGLLSILLTSLIAERIRSGAGWIAAALVAFASPVLFYSALLWEHTPAVALMLFAAHRVTTYLRDGRNVNLVVGAAGVGLAAAGLRTDANLYFAALAGALFLTMRGIERFRAAIFASLGFVVGAFPASLLNAVTNATFLAANTTKNTPRPSLHYLSQAGLRVLTDFCVGRPVPGSLAWPVVVAALGVIVVFYAARRRRPIAFLVAVASLSVASLACLYEANETNAQSFYGFLAISPFIALAFTLPEEARSGDGAQGLRFMLALTSLIALVNLGAWILADLTQWAADGNLEWGPRYWLVLFPAASVCVGVNVRAALDAERKDLAAAFAGSTIALAVVGVGYEILGFHRLHTLETQNAKVRDAMLAEGELPLVIDVYYAAAMSSEQFFVRPSVYIPITSYEYFTKEWFPAAAQKGLTHFVLASQGSIDGHPFLFFPTPGWKLEVQRIDTVGGFNLAEVRAVPDP